MAFYYDDLSKDYYVILEIRNSRKKKKTDSIHFSSDFSSQSEPEPNRNQSVSVKCAGRNA